MTFKEQLCRQANDIEMRAADAAILLEVMSEKLQDMDGLDDDNLRLANAVECFISCTLRNVQLIREHNEHVFAILKAMRRAV